MTLSKMDYWRLADELSIYDAAILMTGNDPSETVETYATDGTCLYDENGHIRMVQRRDYDGLTPCFRALKNAVLSNRLRATIRLPMRTSKHPHYGEYDSQRSDEFDDFSTENEKQFRYDMLIARLVSGERRSNDVEISGQTRLNFDVDQLNGERFLYVSKEPNWAETTIAVDDLKEWLKEKGLYPPFFFPNRPSVDFKDRRNPRYSPKLAACVEAWEQIKGPRKSMSVKQTVKAWLKSNAASFGVSSETGIVSDKLAEELAAIVNWKPKGGATPTPQLGKTTDEKASEPVENYPYGYPEHEDNPEIPF